MVESAGAQTMFFLTWGYVDGDSGNEWLYPDYPTMQSLLQDGYLAYAEACASAERPVWVAPVGPAFGHIRNELIAAGEDPLASGSLFRSLYTGDGSHPSRLGSQLAAYVFFASFSGESPVGLPAPDGLDPATILTLQEAASSVVFDPDDAFTFPWEVGEDEDDSGIAESDTGEGMGSDSGAVPGSDTGLSGSGDTGMEESSCPTDSEDSSPESEEPQDDPPSEGDGGGSEVDDDGSEKRGCSTIQVTDKGGGWLILLPLIGIVRRQWRFR